MKTKQAYLFLGFVIVFLYSCSGISSKSGCDKAIGYWLTQKKPDELGAFKIYKDGVTYIFQEIGNSAFGKDYKSVLSCKDDHLVLNGIPFLGSVDFVTMNSDQHILLLGKDFIKQSENKKWLYENI